MSERPTPETDAETMRDEYDHVDSDIGPFAPSNTVCADFARKLERERDEARAERDVFRDALEYIGACGLSARHLKDYAIEVLPKEAK